MCNSISLLVGAVLKEIFLVRDVKGSGLALLKKLYVSKSQKHLKQTWFCWQTCAAILSAFPSYVNIVIDCIRLPVKRFDQIQYIVFVFLSDFLESSILRDCFARTYAAFLDNKIALIHVHPTYCMRHRSIAVKNFQTFPCSKTLRPLRFQNKLHWAAHTRRRSAGQPRGH